MPRATASRRREARTSGRCHDEAHEGGEQEGERQHDQHEALAASGRRGGVGGDPVRDLLLVGDQRVVELVGLLDQRFDAGDDVLGLRRERLTDLHQLQRPLALALDAPRQRGLVGGLLVQRGRPGLRRELVEAVGGLLHDVRGLGHVLVELLLVARAQREVLEAVALELARVGVAQDLDGDRLGG